MTAALVLTAPQALAETGSYRRTVVSDTETIIGVGVRFDKDCKGIGVPTVLLDSPPANGFVCVRLGRVKPHNLLRGESDHCLQVPMRGAQILYRSRAGYEGLDTVSYTLKFPRFEQSYTVTIKVQAPAGARAPNTRYGAEQQQRGAAPDCAALVS